MRQLLVVTLVLLTSFTLNSQTPPTPQSARQALVEMFFGSAPNHLEKHLPDVTRKTLQKLDSGDGRSLLSEISMLAAQAKAGGANVETFDTGPTLLTIQDADGAEATIGNGTREKDKVEITVEHDDLIGDEDQIEVALHMSRSGKEGALPFVPHFTFAMKTESDVWRLNEITVSVRVPLADPDFLKNIEDRQRGENEQMVMWSVRSVTTAEKGYSAAQGSYACTLSALARKSADGNMYLWDPQLVTGRKGAYIYAISNCDASHYKIVAEPAVADSGQRAFCSDEGGTIRASADGKATTCLSSGESVENTPPNESAATGVLMAGPASNGGAAPAPQQAPAVQSRPSSQLPKRVRVSQGVTQGLIVRKVTPAYPPDARAARVQGQVVLSAVIGTTGEIQNLQVVSGHPLLTQAALDAVKQWKYRPYILQGKPVEVDTTVTVIFALAGQ